MQVSSEKKFGPMSDNTRKHGYYDLMSRFHSRHCSSVRDDDWRYCSTVSVNSSCRSLSGFERTAVCLLGNVFLFRKGWHMVSRKFEISISHFLCLRCGSILSSAEHEEAFGSSASQRKCMNCTLSYCSFNEGVGLHSVLTWSSKWATNTA